MLTTLLLCLVYLKTTVIKRLLLLIVCLETSFSDQRDNSAAFNSDSYTDNSVSLSGVSENCSYQTLSLLMVCLDTEDSFDPDSTLSEPSSSASASTLSEPLLSAEKAGCKPLAKKGKGKDKEKKHSAEDSEALYSLESEAKRTQKKKTKV
jgi:hypothetical protein